MYRKQYKGECRGHTAIKDELNYEQPLCPETKLKNIREYREEKQLKSSNEEKDDFNNNIVNEDELKTTNCTENFQSSHPISRKSDSCFHKTNQEIPRKRVKEKRIQSGSLPNVFIDASDPYNDSVIIDEGDSLSRRVSSAYLADLNKEGLSREEHQLQRQGATSSTILETLEGHARQNLRRSSSLSTIPAYFYPDPYSIVVSRYLEDLGSLSSYSPASGSEATEYLQLSQAATPEIPPPFDITQEGIVEQSAFLSSESESHTTVQALIEKMNFDSALSTSEEYQSFRSSVPLRKICVEADGSKEWKVYDAGPRSIRTPLLCLGPASATADVFYKQILNLTARGLRVISVEGPVYWTVDDWCKGLKKLLDCLNLDKVHIFGASLGGFLAQKFAEYTYHYSRVASLILCNTFLDTSIFDYHDSAMIFWMLPSVILKKLIIENITAARIMDLEIAHAIEFMIERLNNLSQQELASRMTLNCVNCHVDTFKLKQIKMTIMEVFDDSALSSQAREDLARNYTDAKLAHLKSGGNFPYLSRSDDVSMHILVHLRAFNGTKHSAQLEESPSISEGNCCSSNAISINSNAQTNKNNFNHKNPEDILGLTGPQSMPTASLEDKNQAFKEKAASVLGLPVK